MNSTKVQPHDRGAQTPRSAGRPARRVTALTAPPGDETAAKFAGDGVAVQAAMYSPAVIPAAVWALVRDLVLLSLLLLGVRSKGTFIRYAGPFARYAEFLVAEGVTLTVEEAFTHENVETFVARFMEDAADNGLSLRSAEVIVSRVRRNARRLNPAGGFPQTSTKGTHHRVKAPYPAGADALLPRLAATLQNPEKRAFACIAVAAGLGAGATASEMKALTGADVIDRGDGRADLMLPAVAGIVAAPDGPKVAIPVVAGHAAVLLARAREVGDGPLLDLPDTVNAFTTMSWQIRLDRGVRLNTRRLRTTYLVGRLLAGTPLNGVRTLGRYQSNDGLRFLVDYMPEIDEGDLDAHARRPVPRGEDETA